MPSIDPIERFRVYLARAGLKFTKQRRAIAEVFYESGKHLSIAEVLELAREQESSIGHATVYRTMKLLADSGLAVQHQFADGQARFEPARGHHDHIICIDCGRIVEFEDSLIEDRQDAIAARHEFRVASHRLEIYAQCLRDPCPNRTQDPGRGRVHDLDAGLAPPEGGD